MRSAGGTLVWLVDAGALPDSAFAAWAGWLGVGERQRCERFVRAGRRRQFLAGRGLLRLALGRLLDVAPDAIALQERPGQAPLLVSPAACEVGFSISHSGEWVACAVSTETRVGFDIERIDPKREVIALAEHAFAPAEVESLRKLEGEKRSLAFYRMWCEHEARFKLGAPAAAIHFLEHPGLAGALACSRPLATDPVIELRGGEFA